jgi:GT2 family glycosyltransferase
MSDTAISFLHPVEEGLVSVVIPTYNRANLLARAIESALRQTYPRVEVLVIDDGSSDSTASLVKQYDTRVRYFYQSNSGVATARNAGITQARGEFIAFLDSDDIWHDWKVEAQVAAMRAYPDVGLVWTDMTAIDEASRVLHERFIRKMYGAYKRFDADVQMKKVGALADLLPSAPPMLRESPIRVGDLSSEILLGNLLHTPTVLYRRRWADQAGGLSRAWASAGEDYEYYTRLCALGPVMLIDAPTILYRIGADDQITAPDKLLPLARNNLRTVRARFGDSTRKNTLSSRAMRRRIAWSLEWVGTTAFEVGNRAEAARHLAASLRVRPGLDRRLLLLAFCALPNAVVNGLRALRRYARTRRHASHASSE